MNATRRFVGLLLLLTLLFSESPVQAQAAGEVQYFPETGHTVKGNFLRFYKKARDPLLVFGYPITDQIVSKDGKTVQYFQRARLEANGNNSVRLTPLGQATYQPGSRQLNIDNPSACDLFPTGFRVCFAFLDFYKSNGGTARFGNPISPFEFHDNLIVQYFENARFEWRADRSEGQRVVLTDLGRIYFDQLGEDQALLRPSETVNATINNILSINAHAFVSNAITQASGRQTIYIVVHSQTQQAVSEATGKANIHFSDGGSQEYYFTTNASGLGSISFDFENQTQGDLVSVDILVTYQGLSALTTTSFRIWY